MENGKLSTYTASVLIRDSDIGIRHRSDPLVDIHLAEFQRILDTLQSQNPTPSVDSNTATLVELTHTLVYRSAKLTETQTRRAVDLIDRTTAILARSKISDNAVGTLEIRGEILRQSLA